MSTAILTQWDMVNYHMVVGFMATKWTMVLDKLGVNHLQTRSEMLLTLPWGEICKPIWKAQCNIKHYTETFSSIDKMASPVDELTWYHRHQDEVLDYWHRFLVDYDLDDIDRWTRATRRAKVTMINNAMHFYKVKCQQTAPQQSTI